MFRLASLFFGAIGMVLLLGSVSDAVSYLAWMRGRQLATAVVVEQFTEHQARRPTCLSRVVMQPPAPPDTLVYAACLSPGTQLQRWWLPPGNRNRLNASVAARWKGEEVHATDFASFFIGLIFTILSLAFRVFHRWEKA